MAAPADTFDLERTPTYGEVLSGMHTAFSEFADWEKYPPNYSAIFEQLMSLSLCEMLAPILVAVGMTVVRVILTKLVYMPLGRSLQLRKSDQKKLPESAWKLKIYLALWIYNVYMSICSGRYDFFYRPCAIMDFNMTVHARSPIPRDIQVFYMAQTAFYIHSVYATLRLDVWRKDFGMMMIHHFLTIFLLYFSYTMRVHKVGVLVLLLHDISDVLLEVTKLHVYLKVQGGQERRLFDILSTVFFMVFYCSWVWCRLYWFPVKVLHCTHFGVYFFHKDKEPRMFVPFNVMLIILQMLSFYWFILISNLLYKIATGQMSKVEDLREYDEPGEKVE